MEKNYVSLDKGSHRMFKNDFLNALSKVHFTVPIFIFSPVIIYMYYNGISSPELSWLQIVFMSIAGLISWTIVEYCMHRFLFHYEPKSAWGQKLHFLFHGVHHDYPNDQLRLVFPPIVSVPLALFFYIFFNLWIGPDHIFPFYGAFIGGYLVYDMMHYAIHHLELKGKIWKKLKSHHLRHHFVDETKGYGVSSSFWDLIGRTDFPKNKKTNRFSKTSVIAYTVLALVYVIWSNFFIGWRIDHTVFIVFVTGMYFLSDITHKFTIGFIFFIIYWVLYDSMRVFPNFSPMLHYRLL